MPSLEVEISLDETAIQALEIEKLPSAAPTDQPQRTERIKRFIVNNFLPLGFAFALIVALSYPIPGATVRNWKVEGYGVVDTTNVILIFIIAGLTLKTEDVWASLKAYQALIYGLVSILIITACFGFALIEIPMKPKEFSIGLAIFAAVPTTISSGATLVTQGYGNGALALMLTVMSNLLGILTVPFAVRTILASAHVEIKALRLLLKMALSILVPVIIGKLIREFSSRVKTFVNDHKVAFSLLSSSNLICIVWQYISHSRNILLEQSAINVVLAIVYGIVMHMIFLSLNLTAAKILRFEESEMKATLIMCSQKTLPIAVTVISNLSEAEVGDLGLITIPCIMLHIGQLFIDAYIVSRWAARYEKQKSLLPAEP